MMVLEVLAYIVSLGIIGSYVGMVRSGRTKAFNVANALGAPFIIASELVVHAWPPMVLTVFFGLTGAYGWWKAGRLDRRTAAYYARLDEERALREWVERAY